MLLLSKLGRIDLSWGYRFKKFWPSHCAICNIETFSELNLATFCLASMPDTLPTLVWCALKPTGTQTIYLLSNVLMNLSARFWFTNNWHRQRRSRGRDSPRKCSLRTLEYKPPERDICALLLSIVAVGMSRGCRKTFSVLRPRDVVLQNKSYARLMMQLRGKDKRTRHYVVAPSGEAGPDIRHTRAFCNQLDQESCLAPTPV